MLFTQDRDKLRQFYIDAWNKAQAKQAMEPLEEMVAQVVAMHPEFHAFLQKGNAALAREFMPEQGETNPFLHMGLHLGIREQLSTQRPDGIAGIYQKLVKKLGDAHDAEHRLMECLTEMIWTAQTNNTMPDEAQYLECIKRLI
ncbi:MAG: DUF1841 family protein [Gammaproteobacteria bacterium]|nr:DUF1841 family protein [Gammaproteobacteria bacterium]